MNINHARILHQDRSIEWLIDVAFWRQSSTGILESADRGISTGSGVRSWVIQCWVAYYCISGSKLNAVEYPTSPHATTGPIIPVKEAKLTIMVGVGIIA